MYLKETLEEMRQKVKTSFHVPGHHFGNGSERYWEGSLLDYDFTEINGTDNLHHPTEAILASQKRIARLYGSDHSYFLVNGTTGGILASLYALVCPNDVVLMQREVHQSILNGVEIAQGRIAFIEQKLQSEGLCFEPLSPIVFEEAMIKNPSAKVVVLTYPNYYGCGCNIKIMVEIAHKYDKIVMVDSAHGAHFFLNEAFPLCPVKAGADIVVQSTHKTLYAMTQASWLHVQGERVDYEKIERALSMLQSSSPSYVLMTSLDLSGERIEAEGEKLATSLLVRLDDFYSWAKRFGIGMMDAVWHFEAAKDPSRICIDAYSMGLTGYQLGDFLENEGIYSELQTSRMVVLVTTLATTDTDLNALKEALLKKNRETPECDVNKQYQQDCQLANAYNKAALNANTRSDYNLNAIRFVSSRWMPIDEVEGQILTHALTPYPPGVPLCVAGVRIQKHEIDLIQSYVAEGHTVLGVSIKDEIAYVRVAINES